MEDDEGSPPRGSHKESGRAPFLSRPKGQTGYTVESYCMGLPAARGGTPICMPAVCLRSFRRALARGDFECEDSAADEVHWQRLAKTPRLEKRVTDVQKIWERMLKPYPHPEPSRGTEFGFWFIIKLVRLQLAKGSVYSGEPSLFPLAICCGREKYEAVLNDNREELAALHTALHMTPCVITGSFWGLLGRVTGHKSPRTGEKSRMLLKIANRFSRGRSHGEMAEAKQNP